MIRIKRSIQTACEKILFILPDCFYEIVKPLFFRVLGEDGTLYIRLRRFARTLTLHWDNVISGIAKNKRTMIIEKGLYENNYVNVAVLNNMVSLMLYSLYCGCIPQICINEQSEEDFSWGWYFIQPFESLQTDCFHKTKCDRIGVPYTPCMQIVYDENGVDFKIWKFLYEKLVVFNTNTELYIRSEQEQLQIGENTLGILMRGTDYLTTLPKGHPIQPAPQNLLADALKIFNEYHYKNVYVATEEKRLFKLAEECFGQEAVRENKRTYYDENFYSKKDVELICQVHFEREHDNYLKGIEYLSSMMLLSKCGGVVAGNCGGTLFAMLHSSQPHNTKIIYNLGVY